MVFINEFKDGQDQNIDNFKNFHKKNYTNKTAA